PRGRRAEAAAGRRPAPGAALHERKRETVLLLKRARRGELTRGVVDPDDARTPPRQPRRPVGGAAPQLDHVEARRRRQRAHLALGQAPDAPDRLSRRPGAPARPRVVDAETAPPRADPGHA